MTANVGRIDRAARFILGALLILAPMLNMPAVWSNVTLSYLSIVVGLVLVGTSLFRFCPLYRILGLSTCKI